MAGERRYVSDVDPNGWLRVKIEGGGIVALPYHLKVEYTKTKKGRDYFIILEGPHKGKKASVKIKGTNQSYLKKSGRFLGSASVIFDKKKKKLTISDLGTFDAYTYADDPVPDGTYDIEMPAAPHKVGDIYRAYSRYSETWFRVGHSGGRFLHTGRISAGCVTVTERAKWTKIYKHLIISRKNTKSVGTIEIK